MLGYSRRPPPQNMRVPRGIRFHMANVHCPVPSLKRHGTNPAGDVDPRVAKESTGVRRANNPLPSPRCPGRPSSRFRTGRYRRSAAVPCDFSPAAYSGSPHSLLLPTLPMPSQSAGSRPAEVHCATCRAFSPPQLPPCGIRSLSPLSASVRPAVGGGVRCPLAGGRSLPIRFASATSPDPLNPPRLPLLPAGAHPLALMLSPEFLPYSEMLLEPVL